MSGIGDSNPDAIAPDDEDPSPAGSVNVPLKLPRLPLGKLIGRSGGADRNADEAPAVGTWQRVRIHPTGGIRTMLVTPRRSFDMLVLGGERSNDKSDSEG
jgi:hypothetical protein